MPRLTKEVAETTKPSVFENESYHIEHRKYSENIQDFRVTDKKSGEKFGLKLSMQPSSHGADGYTALTFFEGDVPSPADVYAGGLPHDLITTRTIGGHFNRGEDNLWHYKTDLESIMSVYRGLKNGDFKPVQGHKDKSSQVLDFMDKYVFNTDASREVLKEYMAKHPLDAKDNKKENTKAFDAATLAMKIKGNCH